MVTETALVAPKVIELDPELTVVAEVMLALGVEESQRVYVLLALLTGPTNVIEYVVPSAPPAKNKDIELPVQQETIEKSTGTSPFKTLIEKLLPSIDVGYPAPLVMLTRPPAVDPPEAQLTVPTLQLTDKDFELLSPLTFLTLTS